MWSYTFEMYPLHNFPTFLKLGKVTLFRNGLIFCIMVSHFLEFEKGIFCIWKKILQNPFRKMISASKSLIKFLLKTLTAASSRYLN